MDALETGLDLLRVADAIDGVFKASEPLSKLDGYEALYYRALLFAVVDETTIESWNEAYSVFIGRGADGRPMSLWASTVLHANYTVIIHPDQEWSHIPTSEQILLALEAVAE